MRRAILAIVIASAVPGCVSDPPGVDGGHLDASGDGGGGGGLSFRFVTDPDVPGDAGGDHALRVESVRIVLVEVRAIGDAAPGDERTRRAQLELVWSDSEPAALVYDDAPPGLYSRLLGLVASYELRGSVLVGGERVPFAVTDAPGELPVSVELGDPMLDPGGALEIAIEVSVAEPLFEVGWGSFAGAEAIVIDDASPEIDEVREHLAEAFEAGSEDS